MDDFRANKKSARACRGELSSSSMMDTKASAMAWSDTARPLSRALLSSRMAALQEDAYSQLLQVDYFSFEPRSFDFKFPLSRNCDTNLKCSVVATCRIRMGNRTRTEL